MGYYGFGSKPKRTQGIFQATRFFFVLRCFRVGYAFRNGSLRLWFLKVAGSIIAASVIYNIRSPSDNDTLHVGSNPHHGDSSAATITGKAESHRETPGRMEYPERTAGSC